MEDDPYFDKKPPDDEGGDKTVQTILASVRDDKDMTVDSPDGMMKIDPKRTSFVEVGALKDQRSSLAVSLVSSTISSQHLKSDLEDDEVTINDVVSIPGSKHSSSLLYVSFLGIKEHIYFC